MAITYPSNYKQTYINYKQTYMSTCLEGAGGVVEELLDELPVGAHPVRVPEQVQLVLPQQDQQPRHRLCFCLLLLGWSSGEVREVGVWMDEWMIKFIPTPNTQNTPTPTPATRRTHAQISLWYFSPQVSLSHEMSVWSPGTVSSYFYKCTMVW
jgi:hypothetical protein